MRRFIFEQSGYSGNNSHYPISGYGRFAGGGVVRGPIGKPPPFLRNYFAPSFLDKHIWYNSQPYSSLFQQDQQLKYQQFMDEAKSILQQRIRLAPLIRAHTLIGASNYGLKKWGEFIHSQQAQQNFHQGNPVTFNIPEPLQGDYNVFHIDEANPNGVYSPALSSITVSGAPRGGSPALNNQGLHMPLHLEYPFFVPFVGPVQRR